MAKKSSKKPEKGDFKVLKETEKLLGYLVDKERQISATEDALVESMRRFRDLFEQSPAGIGIHSAEGDLLVINKSYLDVFGINSFSDIVHHDLFSDFKLNSKQVKKIKSGGVVQFETEIDFGKVGFKTTRQDLSCLLYTVSPLWGEDEKSVIGYMRQVQDITESKKIAEAQRLAQLGRLLADMAHEVNNPLMIISGRAELTLLEGVKEGKIKDTLKIIMDQCFLAKDIIQSLLKYSRLGKIEKGNVDIQKTLELITDILQHHLRLSNIVLEKDFKLDLSGMVVVGNEKQLQEIFMNVVRNAADAMPSGGKITVTTSKEKKFLKIDVIDTGEGMPKEVMDRIFEPFFTTKQNGTGLGLAVCHTIIQEHGGQLRYASEPGKGTTASILLPIEK